MSKREETYLWLGFALSALLILVLGIGHFTVRDTEINANAKIQVAHEIRMGLTDFGQIWSE